MNITNIDQFEVRLTKNEAEVVAAQKLRYRVFVEEFGAKVSLENNLGKTVLIIDDDPTVSELMKRQLLKENYINIIGYMDFRLE